MGRTGSRIGQMNRQNCNDDFIVGLLSALTGLFFPFVKRPPKAGPEGHLIDSLLDRLRLEQNSSRFASPFSDLRRSLL